MLSDPAPFAGHYPGSPILPGNLLVEALDFPTVPEPAPALDGLAPDNKRLLAQVNLLKQRLYDWPRRETMVQAWEQHSVVEHEDFLALLERGAVDEAAADFAGVLQAAMEGDMDLAAAVAAAGRHECVALVGEAGVDRPAGNEGALIENDHFAGRRGRRR